MKHEEISLRTRQQLSHALKRAMEKKPLIRVSVSELVRSCGMNRNTFYYHFVDIYDLLKWTLEQEAVNTVSQIDLLTNTEQALRHVLDYAEANREFILCAYDSMGREQIKRFLHDGFIRMTRAAIDEGEKELGLQVDDDFKQFTATFFTEAYAEIVIGWLRRNDRSDREQLLQNMLLASRTSIPAMLRRRAEQLAGPL